MEVEHPPRRFPRADAELENPLGLDTSGCLGDGVLQLVVRRHLSTDRPEVGSRVEVELVTAGSVDHGSVSQELSSPQASSIRIVRGAVRHGSAAGPLSRSW